MLAPVRGGIAAVLVLLAAFASSASAATIKVKNGHDSGKGSLRAAIEKANDGDTITVPAVHIKLKSVLLVVEPDLTIIGKSPKKTVIDGRGDVSVFDITAPTKLSQLTVTGGVDETGGGIDTGTGAPLVLTRVVVKGNSANASGGGIFAGDDLTIRRSKIMRNSAGNNVQSGYGGGVQASNSLEVIRSTISKNVARNVGVGGGLYWQPVTFGANAEHFELIASTVDRNTSRPESTGYAGSGGGLALQPIDNGGLSNPALIIGSTISGNRVISANGLNATGGGVWFGPIGNVAGSNLPLDIANSTIAGNTAGGPDDGVGSGGGVYLYPIANAGSQAPVSFNHVTISDNAATDDGSTLGDGGGIFIDHNGTPGLPIFSNSIVAGNRSPGEDDCGGPFQPLANAAHNIERQETCGFDKPNRNPKLEGLKRNGGPTKTMALKPGSPAINRGLGGKVCQPKDQRGKRRPQNKCDIGAFERVRSD